MKTTVSADPAVLLPIRLRVDRDGSISFEFLDSNGDPYEVDQDEWRFIVKINPDRPENVIVIDDEIEFPETHILKVPFVSAITQLAPKTYYYELINDTSNKTIFNGDAFVINGKWKG